MGESRGREEFARIVVVEDSAPVHKPDVVGAVEMRTIAWCSGMIGGGQGSRRGSQIFRGGEKDRSFRGIRSSKVNEMAEYERAQMAFCRRRTEQYIRIAIDFSGTMAAGLVPDFPVPL